MDWIKLRIGHIYGTRMTKNEIAGLVLMQMMTAHFERIPTPEERRIEVSDNLLTRVQQRLDEQSTTLREVLDEVLKDCRRVLERRSTDKVKMENWRKRRENNSLSPVTATDKSRVEENKKAVTVTPSPDTDRKDPDTGRDLHDLGTEKLKAIKDTLKGDKR